jgi:hypothetical protein
MKRLWIGAAVLLILLIGGILSTSYLCAFHQDLTQTLTQAVDSAQAGQWQQALSLCRDARQDWQRHFRFSAAFTDHAPLEEMDQLFAQLEICQEEVLTQKFILTCTRLSHLSQAVGDSYVPHWWNIL